VRTPKLPISLNGTGYPFAALLAAADPRRRHAGALSHAASAIPPYRPPQPARLRKCASFAPDKGLTKPNSMHRHQPGRAEKMSRFWSSLTHDLKPYVPGEQLHAGSGQVNTTKSVGPSPRALEAIAARLRTHAAISGPTGHCAAGCRPPITRYGPNSCSSAMARTSAGSARRAAT
jgi:hypothetical protein